MGRGGPEIPLEADEVAAWASLTVANPKGEPSAEEREQLKAAKAAEKKGKDAVLEGVLSRLGELNKTLAEPIPLKKDKLKKALDAKAKEAAAAAEESASRPFWLDPPSGTRDFEPGDMRVRNWLFGAMRETALEFGFKEYDAPVLEHVELYERKAGEEISSQMYNFVDKEGARVTLRPEMTPSLARMATGEVRATLPLKWFSIPQCWRFETTQRGRKREHYQWNMDIVGERGVTAEAELLAAVARFFSRLGVTSEMVGVRVNSRKVLDVAITKAGVPGDKFAPASSSTSSTRSARAAKSVADLATTVGLPMTDPAIAEIAQLFELADSYGVGDYLQFDSSVVRGLAYYTGVVFEAFDRKGELRAICGGGRYDKLLELYGGEKCDIPCAGFGFGDCVIVELLKENGLLPKLGPSVDVVVAPFSAAMQGPAAPSARNCGPRAHGRRALQACKARKAFDLANRAGARLVAFVAPDEWDVGKAEARAKGAAWVPVGRSSSSASPAPAPPAGAVLATAATASRSASTVRRARALGPSAVIGS
ncbi:histidyl-trna synthetase [Aureococcus anophagefferens]|nr:histidyl-trna synthetase [Aureococcus anophagefferens]